MNSQNVISDILYIKLLNSQMDFSQLYFEIKVCRDIVTPLIVFTTS